MTVEYLILRHDIIESVGVLCHISQKPGLKNTPSLASAIAEMKRRNRHGAMFYMLEFIRPEVNIKSPAELLSFGLN
jgi:hypothetical protein